MRYADHFSRFLLRDPRLLYFAAHCQHPLPDVSLKAQQQAWLDQADSLAAHAQATQTRLQQALAHVARCLNLPDDASLSWGASADSLLTSLLESTGAGSLDILSVEPLPPALATRLQHLEARGHARITRINLQPFQSFEARWGVAVRKGSFDWVCLSQCCDRTAFVPTGLLAMASTAADGGARVLIDGSQGFMALDTDLASIAAHASYIAQSPPYAMSGRGYAFLYTPTADGTATPPAATTCDPSPLYRFVAAMNWLQAQSLTANAVHAHVGGLQARLLSRLDALGLPLSRSALLPPLGSARGNFLSFALVEAEAMRSALAEDGVIVDADSHHLRIGFDIHHGNADIDALSLKLRDALA